MSMTIDGTSGIAFPSGTVEGDAGIGYGQTTQNVTSSRSSGTTYTNSTTKPILCFVTCNNINTTWGLTINGVTLTAPIGGAVMFMVPAGQTYNVSWNTTLQTFIEIR